MKSLLRELRQLRADYRRVKSPADDLADIAAALVCTAWVLIQAANIAMIFGGY